MQTPIDYPKLNEAVIELDEAILASSIVSKQGILLAHSTRPGYEKLGLDSETEKNWGSWLAIMVSVARQGDKIFTDMEYIATGRKEFKGLIVPFDILDLIIRVVLTKKTESTFISDKILDFLKQFTGNSS